MPHSSRHSHDVVENGKEVVNEATQAASSMVDDGGDRFTSMADRAGKRRGTGRRLRPPSIRRYKRSGPHDAYAHPRRGARVRRDNGGLYQTKPSYHGSRRARRRIPHRIDLASPRLNGA